MSTGDHEGLDASRGALVDDVEHECSRHRDDGEVYASGGGSQSGIAGHALQFRGVGVDRIHGAREAARRQRVQDAPADAPGRP